ncbi:Nnf1a [Drosophila busckii]|uniref:Nnf1a n=1 Tax=Drosophila busckii TaxID=30019 RepID=A0A0M4EG95_DROBS|nr:uncharacterized protein LOC108595839 [Drosophila busckii]ALC42526.1 Nnf1a [Drosophila busckii]
MSQASKKCLADIAESVNKHNPTANQLKEEYDDALANIFTELSGECLEPFAAILLEHENTILTKDSTIERMRQRMSQLLSQISEQFWSANDVANKLITLEVLKEKFEHCKGTNWNVPAMSPEERTRPVRMRLMGKSIRFLENQIASQEKALEIALTKSRENRERIQHIQNERIKLNALMQQQSDTNREIVPKILDLLAQSNQD